MILIIDNYDSFTYNLYQSIAQFRTNIQVIRNDCITVAAIAKLNPTAIILSPGPSRPENAGICLELIKKLYTTIPILGVCLGHQAITMAFGGKVIQAQEIVHGKQTYIFHNRQNIFNNIPLPFVAGRYHSLIVDKETLPQELIVTAENENETVMALKHTNYPLYGVQFHPESILTPEGNKLISNFLAAT
jgi:anthranilate synthase/aminodeoxychorismate synthase-like glutamine amidotransferase